MRFVKNMSLVMWNRPSEKTCMTGVDLGAEDCDGSAILEENGSSGQPDICAIAALRPDINELFKTEQYSHFRI